MIRVPSRYLFLDPEDCFMKAAPIRALTATLKTFCFDILHMQTPLVAHQAGLRLSKRLRLPKVETYPTFFEDYLEYDARFSPHVPSSDSRHGACLVGSAIAWRPSLPPRRLMRQQLKAYRVTAKIAVIPTGIELREFAAEDGAGVARRLLDFAATSLIAVPEATSDLRGCRKSVA